MLEPKELQKISSIGQKGGKRVRSLEGRAFTPSQRKENNMFKVLLKRVFLILKKTVVVFLPSDPQKCTNKIHPKDSLSFSIRVAIEGVIEETDGCHQGEWDAN